MTKEKLFELKEELSNYSQIILKFANKSDCIKADNYLAEYLMDVKINFKYEKFGLYFLELAENKQFVDELINDIKCDYLHNKGIDYEMQIETDLTKYIHITHQEY